VAAKYSVVKVDGTEGYNFPKDTTNFGRNSHRRGYGCSKFQLQAPRFSQNGGFQPQIMHL